MHFGTLQPTQDPHPQPGRVTRRTGFPRAGSYRTSSSAHVPNTQPLPRPHRAGTATNSPRTQLQPLAHTDSCTGALPSYCSAHPPRSPRRMPGPLSNAQIAETQRIIGFALLSLRLFLHELLRLLLPLTHIRETSKNSPLACPALPVHARMAAPEWAPRPPIQRWSAVG